MSELLAFAGGVFTAVWIGHGVFTHHQFLTRNELRDSAELDTFMYLVAGFLGPLAGFGNGCYDRKKSK